MMWTFTFGVLYFDWAGSDMTLAFCHSQMTFAKELSYLNG